MMYHTLRSNRWLWVVAVCAIIAYASAEEPPGCTASCGTSSISISDADAEPGDTVTFTATRANDGTAACCNSMVDVTLELPDGSTNTLLGTMLFQGESVSISETYTVTDDPIQMAWADIDWVTFTGPPPSIGHSESSYLLVVGPIGVEHLIDVILAWGETFSSHDVDGEPVVDAGDIGWIIEHWEQ